MSDVTSRAKGNEVVSATLIEIMLVLVFVLLIVLVFEQRGSQQDRASLERLCPVLRETVEQMNFRNLAQQIDCELVKSDPEEALRSWLEVLGTVIKAGGLTIDLNPPGGERPPNIYVQLRQLVEENRQLKDTNARLEKELKELRAAYENLKKQFEQISGSEIDLEQALQKIIALTEQLARYKELLADAEKTVDVLTAQRDDYQRRLNEAVKTIEELEATIADLQAQLGPGDGLAPGVCMGRRRADGSLSPDYLVRVDYTGDEPIVTLRSDNRHAEEIASLTSYGLIPEELRGGASVAYTPESFRADFAPLYAYSLKREPACRYQALLYLNKDDVVSKAAEKEKLISGFFFLDIGRR